MIQASFTDLVGTTAVPAHAFDIEELTDLTPALNTATAAHDTAEQAGQSTWTMTGPPMCGTWPLA